MTVGLPGTGIGGVFYLLSALLMPFTEIVKTLRGKSSLADWRLVIKQLSLGLAILAAMWLLGLIAANIFNLFASVKPTHAGVLQNIHTHITNTAFHLNIFHIAPILMSIVTLSVILTLTNLLRIFIRPLASKVT